MTVDVDPYEFLPLPHLPFHILLALGEEDVLHGWGVIRRIEEITQGKTCPSTGSLYLAMGRLQKRGLLAQVDAPAGDSDPRRKYYRLTSLGRRVVEAESQRLAGLVEVARSSNLLGSED